VIPRAQRDQWFVGEQGDIRSSLEVSARSVDFSGNRRRDEAASEEFDPEMVLF
jgi:hypothetical protein